MVGLGLILLFRAIGLSPLMITFIAMGLLVTPLATFIALKGGSPSISQEQRERRRGSFLVFLISAVGGTTGAIVFVLTRHPLRAVTALWCAVFFAGVAIALGRSGAVETTSE